MPTRQEVTRAVRRSGLSSASRLVMLVLADVADNGTAEIPERYTPSLSVLADETGMDRRTVQRQLLLLEADGWLSRERPEVDLQRRGERVRYRLLVAAQDRHPDRSADGTQPPGGRSETATGGGPVPPLYMPSDSPQEPSSSGIPPTVDRPDVEKVCRHLADRIVDNGSKRPTISVKWRTEARLLLDKDGRTVEQVIKAIDWCQTDPFWRGNVLSMPTLREKYDQLRLAASRNGHARASPASNAPDRVPPELACPEHPAQPATDCRDCAARAKAKPRGGGP